MINPLTAGLLLSEAIGLTQGNIRARLAAALAEKNADGGYCWIADVIGGETGTVIWEEGSAFWAAPYSVKENSVKIDLTKVERVMPRTSWDRFDGAAFESEAVMEANLKKLEAKTGTESLKESVLAVAPLKCALREALGGAKTALIKLIAPGWGSEGFYPVDTLKKAAKEGVFHAGLQMLWNHPTDAEFFSRPEGDLRDLAARLTENAKWMENGPAGPGLYAPAQIFDQFAGTLSDLWEHIGVSIRYFGSKVPGSAEGKAGDIVSEIRRALSVDFVTLAGAGGEVVQMFESARGAASLPKGESMNEEQIKALVASTLQSTLPGLITESLKQPLASIASLQKENATLKAQQGLTVAAKMVREAYQAPDITVHSAMLEHAITDLCAVAPMSESGELDADKFKPMIEARLKRDAATFATLTGSGKVTGAGTAAESANMTDEQYRTRMEAVAKRAGLTDEQAKVWAA